jgi:preprotein translocase subunit SecA
MSEQVKLWIDEIVEDTVAQFTVETYSEEWDLEALTNAMAQLYGSEITAQELREDLGDDISRDLLIEEFQTDGRDSYSAKEEQFGLTDDTTPLMRELERFVILQVVDVRWREHLENMDYMREGIGLRGLAQKDPLVEYRNEGHTMFQDLTRAIREEVVTLLYHAEVTPDDGSGALQQPQGNAGNGSLTYEHESLAGAEAILAAGGSSTYATGGGGGGSVATPVAQRPKVNSEFESVGRNDPCPCGSGKKYKKCHGA